MNLDLSTVAYRNLNICNQILCCKKTGPRGLGCGHGQARLLAAASRVSPVTLANIYGSISMFATLPQNPCG